MLSNGVKVILVSRSARRKKLLKSIIPQFRVLHPRISEPSPSTRTSPYQYVRKMARLKAESVSVRVKDALIIGADTVVWNGRKIIGKPHSRQDAYRILKMLAGTRHSVITGVCVLDSATGRFRIGHEKTILRMKKLSDTQLRQIISRRRHMDKAGGYAIQESGDKYISLVRGRLDNAVGLPLNLVRQFISQLSRHPAR